MLSMLIACRPERNPNAGSRRDQPRSCRSVVGRKQTDHIQLANPSGQLGIRQRQRSEKAGTWRLRASDGANGAPKMPEVRMARL